jgi:hypothetical protein
MFRPIFTLPGALNEEQERLTHRWDEPANKAAKKKILNMIRAGGGKDFLQGDFENGEFPMLKNYTDLRGISLFKEDIKFPENYDNFKSIDFTFAEFYHSKFKSACFLNSYFEFARIYNCEFIDCAFGFTNFFGCILERVKFINCSFNENNSFHNCDFKSTTFDSTGFRDRLFFDCRFDEQTRVNEPVPRGRATLADIDRAEFLKGIREGYEAGDVVDIADDYFVDERKKVTRFNTTGCTRKIRGYLLELVTGYGVRPIRVLTSMFFIFVIYSGIFAVKFGCADGLMLSAGAFFTFGAQADLLNSACLFWRIIYILEAFFGVALMATFITVLARKWLGHR